MDVDINFLNDEVNWCKGEIYDIKAVMNSINQKDAFEKNLKKTESKKVNTEASLDNINAGREIMRTIFKNEKDSSKLQTTIEGAANELENLEVLITLITIYLGEKIIHQFKKNKLKLYHRLMQQFTVIEINNEHETTSFWSNVLSKILIKNAPTV
jgi:hypothetical protein